MLLRRFQDSRAPRRNLFPLGTCGFMELIELYSAANAGRNSGSFVEF
jgi:hypothetical protein